MKPMPTLLIGSATLAKTCHTNLLWSAKYAVMSTPQRFFNIRGRWLARSTASDR